MGPPVPVLRRRPAEDIVVPLRSGGLGGVVLLIGLLAGCGSSARRINPDLRHGPRAPEAEGFSFTCAHGPRAARAPVAIRRLCSASRAERISTRPTDDGGLRVRVRFADVRGPRLELYLYPTGGRGAILVGRRGREGEPIETEPEDGWIAIDHLDVERRSTAVRYALTFGDVRISGSLVVNRRVAAPGGDGGGPRGSPQRARRP